MGDPQLDHPRADRRLHREQDRQQDRLGHDRWTSRSASSARSSEVLSPPACFGMSGVTGVNIWSIIVSVIGAVIVLWVYHKFVADDLSPVSPRRRPSAPPTLRLRLSLRPTPSTTPSVRIGPLPERRARLQEIHQHLGRRERFAAMRRGDGDEDDLLAGRNPSEAMDHGHAHQRPARLRPRGRPAPSLPPPSRDNVRVRGPRAAALVAAIADEDHSRSNVLSSASERGGLAAGVEVLPLDADVRRHLIRPSSVERTRSPSLRR